MLLGASWTSLLPLCELGSPWGRGPPWVVPSLKAPFAFPGCFCLGSVHVGDVLGVPKLGALCFDPLCKKLALCPRACGLDSCPVLAPVALVAPGPALASARD